MTEIKHKITNLLNSVNEDNIAYDELELTLNMLLIMMYQKMKLFHF